MKLITREKLEHIAKKILNYPLHDAEKDYFLGLVMKIISKSDAVFYKIQIEKKDLVSFFKNLEIPKINKTQKTNNQVL